MEQMQADAIEQIRARVKYQKEVLEHHAAHGGHHNPAANLAEMWRWVNISFFVGLPVCVISVVYSFIMDEHPHRADGELPEYMVVRSKEFPWQCSSCDLFDYPCWKKCKADKK
jgi:cytochrome c oxidase subunit 6a